MKKIALFSLITLVFVSGCVSPSNSNVEDIRAPFRDSEQFYYTNTEEYPESEIILESQTEEGKSNNEECVDNYTATAFEQGFCTELIQTDLENDILIINNGLPYYNKEEFSANSYEYYGNLDSLGRCTSCFCNIGPETLPVTERGDISGIKPTGYNRQTRYDIIEEWETESEGYLYNRCHLVGWQLTGEDANERNLITGTRYFNAYLMLEYENIVASYVRVTGNHVLYRVTPVFIENNLVASGVLMEAQSIEDDTIEFNVYIRNTQPGIVIDYATGISWETNESLEDYILNIRSKKIHSPTCEAVNDIGKNNKEKYYGLKSDLLLEGYTTCSICEP